MKQNLIAITYRFYDNTIEPISVHKHTEKVYPDDWMTLEKTGVQTDFLMNDAYKTVINLNYKGTRNEFFETYYRPLIKDWERDNKLKSIVNNTVVK